jgi:hypothetical protein
VIVTGPPTVGNTQPFIDLSDDPYALYRAAPVVQDEWARRRATAAQEYRVRLRDAERFKEDPVYWASRHGIELWSGQREILEAVRDHSQVGVASCHEVGKALALNTDVPTPTGWRTMADLRVGDLVYDERGAQCVVTSVTPTWNVDTYRVTFGDGTEIVTSGDHEWNVWPTQARHLAGGVDRRTRWDLTRKRTTAQLAVDRAHYVKWFIPLTMPIQGDESVELSIPPYLLGLWLGDGDSHGGGLTQHTADVDEILSHVDWPWHVATVSGNVKHIRFRGLTHALAELGVRNDKHIPVSYLRAGAEARRELVRGIMDTDGHCSPCALGGRFDVGQKNKRLADDIAELLAGLGCQITRKTRRVSIYGKDCGNFYVIGATSDFEPFKLKRKLASWRPRSCGSTLRAIKKIEQIETVPTRCITVDSPSHLYLATRSFIPTHNSFSAALVTAWWVDAHPDGEARVVTSAPTDKQVKAILWSEINQLHSRLGLRGRTNLSEWYLGNFMAAFGRKPADQDPTAFQGIHARYMLVVLDEACGIPTELWDAASSLVANVHGKILAIGNPDDEHSRFADNMLRDQDWHKIFIGYEDTPNFTGESVSDSLKEMLIHPRWVDERRRKWGEDSALFISKCRGRFPRGQSPFVCIPVTMAEVCRNVDHPEGTPIEGGIDVGAGGDRTIIRERRGPKVGREATFVDSDPMRTIGNLIEKINEWQLTKVKVDVIGVGWGLVGRLRELSSAHNQPGAVRGETTHSAEVVPFNAAEKARDADRFINRRAEMWWHGRELSRMQAWDLEAIDDDTLQELTTPLYELADSRGRVKIQKKDEVIKVLGRSPDSAEALLMAFYDVPTEGSVGSSLDLSQVDLLEGLTPGRY